MEGESELKNRIFGHPAASKKGEIFVKQFFQTLEAIFSYKRMFFTNVQKANIIAFIEEKKCCHPPCLLKTPLPFFLCIFCCFPTCMPRFFILFSFRFLEPKLRKLHVKIYTFSMKIYREVISQKWLLFDAFSHMKQLSYSALIGGKFTFTRSP